MSNGFDTPLSRHTIAIEMDDEKWLQKQLDKERRELIKLDEGIIYERNQDEFSTGGLQRTRN